jgi:hypothetical protein
VEQEEEGPLLGVWVGWHLGQLDALLIQKQNLKPDFKNTLQNSYC